MKKYSVLLILLTLATSSNTYAHGGHGNFNGNQILHYLTSPIHLFIILGVIIGAIFLFGYRKSLKQKS